MKIKGQSTIEFTFGVVITMLLVYGMVHVFRWVGMDLAQRRYNEDNTLIRQDLPGGDPAVQLNADISDPLPLSAVYHGNFADGKARP